MNELTPSPESLAMHRDELSPEVRSYADNLRAQIKEQLAGFGITSEAELEQAVLSGQLTTAATQPILDRMERLERVAATNKIEFFETLSEEDLRQQYA